uniref:Zgc:113425 n=1 Tax=Neogobius melanostomus TaxID=47308 RepID=A0A8C6WQE2_9GOBI
MDRYRYFMFAQGRVLVLGMLQVACAGLCVVCGVMDAVFRKNTPLSTTRTPIWGGMVSVLVLAACLSCAASVFVSGYSCLTLTYGEEDAEVFHHHHNPQVTFVLHRMVKGANATILLSCVISLLLSSAIAYVACRSLPFCRCYDARTGLETLVPQCDPGTRSWCAHGQPQTTIDCSTLQLRARSAAAQKSRARARCPRTADFPDHRPETKTFHTFFHNKLRRLP